MIPSLTFGSKKSKLTIHLAKGRLRIAGAASFDAEQVKLFTEECLRLSVHLPAAQARMPRKRKGKPAPYPLEAVETQ